MPHPAEHDAFAKPMLSAVPRTLHAVSQPGETLSPQDSVILRLAADRLRDLRDEGLTAACIGRMYGLESEELEAIAARLLPSRG
jgi:hypothetical protein